MAFTAIQDRELLQPDHKGALVRRMGGEGDVAQARRSFLEEAKPGPSRAQEDGLVGDPLPRGGAEAEDVLVHAIAPGGRDV
jgi:hypothetical protein